MGWNAAKSPGNIREFYIAWRVATLLEMSGNFAVVRELTFCQEIIGNAGQKILLRKLLFLKNKTCISHVNWQNTVLGMDWTLSLYKHFQISVMSVWHVLNLKIQFGVWAGKCGMGSAGKS